MHYGELEKWEQKWPTLTNYLSVDVDPKKILKLLKQKAPQKPKDF